MTNIRNFTALDTKNLLVDLTTAFPEAQVIQQNTQIGDLTRRSYVFYDGLNMKSTVPLQLIIHTGCRSSMLTIYERNDKIFVCLTYGKNKTEIESEHDTLDYDVILKSVEEKIRELPLDEIDATNGPIIPRTTESPTCSCM